MGLDTSLISSILTSAGAGTALIVVLVLSGLLRTRHEIEALTRAAADAAAQRDREAAEKREAETQRDDALRIARDQIVPMMSSFNATVSALLPVLQALISQQERGGGRR